MRQPKPWFRKQTRSWYLQLDGKQINLGAKKRDAWNKYHEIMANGRASTRTLTVVRLTEKYLAWCEHNLAPATFKKNRFHLRRFGAHIKPQLIATEPAGASLLAGKEWQPHKIQGWTPDFVPAVLDRNVYDELIPVTDEEAAEGAFALARQEGIFVGTSAGGTLAAGLKIADKAPNGSVILAMLPDTGERYLGAFPYAELPDGSDDEWLASL